MKFFHKLELVAYYWYLIALNGQIFVGLIPFKTLNLKFYLPIHIARVFSLPVVYYLGYFLQRFSAFAAGKPEVTAACLVHPANMLFSYINHTYCI